MITEAESFFDSLKRFLRDEENVLLKGETLAIVHSTTGSPIHIDTIVLYNPLAIAFIGRDMTDGIRASVFAHVSSIELQFRIVKHQLEEPRQPIGFIIAQPTGADDGQN